MGMYCFNSGKRMKSVLIIVVSVYLYSMATVYAQTKGDTAFALPLAYELPEYSQVYDDQRNPFNDANAALALAKKTNRNVLIEIGGNWCTWCHKMDAFLLKHPEVYQSLHNKYVLLKISVSDVNENEAFMKSLPPVLGYPHMYISTASGKMLRSKDTAELQDNKGYSREYWLTFLAKWEKSPAVTAI